MRNTVVSFADLHIKSNLFPTLPSETLSQSCEKLPLATMTLFSNATYLTVFYILSGQKLYSGALGALERLKQNWPIVLGTFLSILVVAGTLVALWKTGVLAKMRPYQLDEAEVKKERRKSQMRMSVRYSRAISQE